MFQKRPVSVPSRILLGVAAVLTPILGLSVLVRAMLPAGTQSSAGLQLGVALLASLLAFAGYIMLYRWLEQRRISELALRPMAAQLALGLAIGAVLLSLTVAVAALVGKASIISVNPLVAMLPGFAMALQSASIEELLFRGILMRVLNARFGSLPALLVSGLIFGGLHWLNPGATWVSALAVAVEAGVLLGVAYLYSGTLWLPIGIHFGWNFVQTGIFGLAVSGNSLPDGLLNTSIGGPTWVTGGAFGVEQSLQAVVFCLLASAVLYQGAKRKGHLKKARWRTGAA